MGANLLNTVLAYKPDLVVLSGFMRILPSCVVDALSPNLINTHPSYLPEFPGMNAVEDALRAGVKQPVQVLSGWTMELTRALLYLR